MHHRCEEPCLVASRQSEIGSGRACRDTVRVENTSSDMNVGYHPDLIARFSSRCSKFFFEDVLS